MSPKPRGLREPQLDVPGGSPQPDTQSPRSFPPLRSPALSGARNSVRLDRASPDLVCVLGAGTPDAVPLPAGFLLGRASL